MGFGFFRKVLEGILFGVASCELGEFSCFVCDHGNILTHFLVWISLEMLRQDGLVCLAAGAA